MVQNPNVFFPLCILSLLLLSFLLIYNTAFLKITPSTYPCFPSYLFLSLSLVVSLTQLALLCFEFVLHTTYYIFLLNQSTSSDKLDRELESSRLKREPPWIAAEFWIGKTHCFWPHQRTTLGIQL